MGATLQLARLSKELLEDNWSDLNSLLEFELLGDECYFDADDDSILLSRLLCKLNKKVLHLVFEGEKCFSDEYWVAEQPALNSESAVQDISNELACFTEDAMAELFLFNYEELCIEFSFHSKMEYVHELVDTFKKLKTFFSLASANNHCVVVWWD